MRFSQGDRRVTVEQILDWADEHHRQTGRWPTQTLGLVSGSGGETWGGIDAALTEGYRGLSGSSSLAKLLAEHRGVRNKGHLPTLTIEQILQWADAHHSRTGQYPQSTSGPIPEAPGEAWHCVNSALHSGRRGLPGRLSLNALLAEHRGVPRRIVSPRLSVELILHWADEHCNRTGRWPNVEAGRVQGTGPTWRTIDHALRGGSNALLGGSSLYKLLKRHRGLRKQQFARH